MGTWLKNIYNTFSTFKNSLLIPDLIHLKLLFKFSNSQINLNSLMWRCHDGSRQTSIDIKKSAGLLDASVKTRMSVS